MNGFVDWGQQLTPAARPIVPLKAPGADTDTAPAETDPGGRAR